MFGYLFAFARRTIAQALVALGLTDSDWSAFYRLFGIARIGYEVLGDCFFEEILTHMVPSEPFVAVVDGVQVVPDSVQHRYTRYLSPA